MFKVIEKTNNDEKLLDILKEEEKEKFKLLDVME